MAMKFSYAVLSSWKLHAAQSTVQQRMSEIEAYFPGQPLQLRGAVHLLAKHDDRKGHHYYTRLRRPVKTEYSSDDPAVIMGWRGGHHAHHATHSAKK